MSPAKITIAVYFIHQCSNFIQAISLLLCIEASGIHRIHSILDHLLDPLQLSISSDHGFRHFILRIAYNHSTINQDTGRTFSDLDRAISENTKPTFFLDDHDEIPTQGNFQFAVSERYTRNEQHHNSSTD